MSKTGRKGLFCLTCDNNFELYNKDIEFSWDMHKQEISHLEATKVIKKKEIIFHNKDDMKNYFKSTKSILKRANKLETLAWANEIELQKISQDLKKFFQELLEFDNINPILFGSRITKLATKSDADLDVFIDTDDTINNKTEGINVIKNAYKLMTKKYYEVWSNFCYFTYSRIPILKTVHKETGISCDISVLNGFGVYNTKLVNLYLQNIPSLRKLILLIRDWFTQEDSNKIINNYGLSMMALFYVQNIGIAPSVYSVSDECTNVFIKAGYQCVDFSTVNFNSTTNETVNQNIKELIQGFFNFYSNFNYTNQVICPLLGKEKPLLKKDFENQGKKLPLEMRTYYERFQKQCEDEPKEFEMNDGINLQDPIELDHNITKCADETFKNNFVITCKAMHRILKNMP